HGSEPVYWPSPRLSDSAQFITQAARADRALVAGAQRAGCDVDDRARARAVSDWKACAVEVHPADRRRIERAQQALKVPHVKGIGQRDAIELDQHVIERRASDIRTR